MCSSSSLQLLETKPTFTLLVSSSSLSLLERSSIDYWLVISETIGLSSAYDYYSLSLNIRPFFIGLSSGADTYFSSLRLTS
jgi:hypothetical protein